MSKILESYRRSSKASYGLLSDISAHAVIRDVKEASPTLGAFLVAAPNDHALYINTPRTAEQISNLLELLYDCGVPQHSSVQFQASSMSLSWVR